MMTFLVHKTDGWFSAYVTNRRTAELDRSGPLVGLVLSSIVEVGFNEILDLTTLDIRTYQSGRYTCSSGSVL